MSNAAILFPIPCLISDFNFDPASDLESAGVYVPTRRVFGVLSLGARSCHLTFSGDFLDVGVKKEETAAATTCQ